MAGNSAGLSRNHTLAATRKPTGRCPMLQEDSAASSRWRWVEKGAAAKGPEISLMPAVIDLGRQQELRGIAARVVARPPRGSQSGLIWCVCPTGQHTGRKPLLV